MRPSSGGSRLLGEYGLNVSYPVRRSDSTHTHTKDMYMHTHPCVHLLDGSDHRISDMRPSSGGSRLLGEYGLNVPYPVRRSDSTHTHTHQRHVDAHTCMYTFVRRVRPQDLRHEAFIGRLAPIGRIRVKRVLPCAPK